MTRRMSAILGEYSPAGQGCTRHFSVPPLEYKNLTSYKKYRPEFGLNIQESYGKRPIRKKGEKYHRNLFPYLCLSSCLFLGELTRCGPPPRLALLPPGASIEDSCMALSFLMFFSFPSHQPCPR